MSIVDAIGYGAADRRRTATEIYIIRYANFVGCYIAPIRTSSNTFITTQLGCIIVSGVSAKYNRIGTSYTRGFKPPLQSRSTSNNKFLLRKRYAETGQVTIGNYAWRGDGKPVSVR